MFRTLFRVMFALTLVSLFGISAAQAAGSRTLFITSAVEGPNNTVTFPLYRGLSGGKNVYYILLDASTSSFASQYGINRPNKLANAAGTAAVQKVTIVNGVINFPASVDFSPTRVIVPSATGFPPADAAPGAIGEPGYSPLIQLPDGTVVNAPHVLNGSGKADKVISYDLAAMKVVFQETDGFSGGKAVHYVSTDASDPGVAAIENVTYAPALAAAPSFGDDSTASAQTDLAAFINGQTGAANPNRQGVNSALLDGLDPLNILRWAPNQGRYSPLWDVHPAAWSEAAIAQGLNTRQMDWGKVQSLVDKGFITGPGGAPFGPLGAIVNCPIVSQE